MIEAFWGRIFAVRRPLDSVLLLFWHFFLPKMWFNKFLRETTCIAYVARRLIHRFAVITEQRLLTNPRSDRGRAQMSGKADVIPATIKIPMDASTRHWVNALFVLNIPRWAPRYPHVVLMTEKV